MNYISYYRYERFNRCPKLLYYDKLLPRKGDRDLRNAMVGSVVHTIVEDYLSDKVERKDLFNHIWPVFSHMESNNTVVWRGRNDRSNVLSSIRPMLSNTLELFDEHEIYPTADLSSGESILTEWSFRNSNQNVGLRLGGRIDILKRYADGTYQIFDLKCTTRPNVVYDPDQIQIYALALLFDKKNVRDPVGYYLLPYEQRSQPVPFSEHEFSVLMANMLDACESIDTLPLEDYAKPGYHCSYCDYYKICPDRSTSRKKMKRVPVVDLDLED